MLINRYHHKTLMRRWLKIQLKTNKYMLAEPYLHWYVVWFNHFFVLSSHLVISSLFDKHPKGLRLKGNSKSLSQSKQRVKTGFLIGFANNIKLSRLEAYFKLFGQETHSTKYLRSEPWTYLPWGPCKVFPSIFRFVYKCSQSQKKLLTCCLLRRREFNRPTKILLTS